MAYSSLHKSLYIAISTILHGFSLLWVAFIIASSWNPSQSLKLKHQAQTRQEQLQQSGAVQPPESLASLDIITAKLIDSLKPLKHRGIMVSMSVRRAFLWTPIQLKNASLSENLGKFFQSESLTAILVIDSRRGPLTHLCRPVRSTFAVRETASLGIMGAPRVPP